VTWGYQSHYRDAGRFDVRAGDKLIERDDDIVVRMQSYCAPAGAPGERRGVRFGASHVSL
jgi:hypothetical protein